MRGIAGILHFDQQPVRSAQMERLLLALAPGDFDRRTHAGAGAASFGHVLRCIAPEDRFEAQPLRGANGSMLFVTDASLDNRDELSASFGWSRADAARQPDSAFVLAAYEKWGDACPARIDGRWAFAAWHTLERRFFAAVDHFSSRPFYYFSRGSFFAFGTTLRGLLSLPEVPRNVHDGVLADHLLNSRSHPGCTLYREIKSLPAAHHLQADASGIETKRYWHADPRKELRLASDEEYLSAFRAELDQTINASLRVEGNVGIMVSGGLDSAAATAVAGKLLAAQGRRLQAIHHLPPNGGPRQMPGRELDESRYVRAMQAYMPHIDFHFIPPAVASSRISFERWDTLLDCHCVPFGGVPFEKVNDPDNPLRDLKLRRMLTGLGGNYTVSLEAYPSDYFLQLAIRMQWCRLWRELHGHARFYHRTVRHLIKYRIIKPLLPAREAIRDNRMATLDCLSPDFVRQTDMVARLRRPRFLRWKCADFDVKRRLAWIIDELMPQNVGVCGSVIGHDVRCDNLAPLMTRRLNEFCLSMPLPQQIRDGQDRLLLRHAMKDLLPEAVIWRTSRGFDAPDSWAVARQLITVLPDALDELERSSLAAHYVNLHELRRLLASAPEAALHRIGPNRLIKLFNVAWFLRWLEKLP